jgi:hypothetical protein
MNHTTQEDVADIVERSEARMRKELENELRRVRADIETLQRELNYKAEERHLHSGYAEDRHYH